MRRRGTPRRRWTRASVAVLVATYLPQAWVVLMPGSWSGYRISWIKMYPILPGLLPAAIGRRFLRFDEWALLAVAGACTGLILVLAWWAASRGPRWLIVTSILLLVANIPLAFALHAAYAA